MNLKTLPENEWPKEFFVNKGEIILHFKLKNGKYRCNDILRSFSYKDIIKIMDGGNLEYGTSQSLKFFKFFRKDFKEAFFNNQIKEIVNE